MITRTERIESRYPEDALRAYEVAGWAVRQIVKLKWSSELYVWILLVVLEREE